VIRRIINRFRKKQELLPFFLADNKSFTAKYAVGKYTYGLPRVLEFQDPKPGRLTIGSFCSIADNVTIYLSGNHRVDWVTTYPFNKVFKEFESFQGHPASKGDVVIGNDVWIGMDVLILSGITIGDGAVIGARSVVTKNVEPYSIVAGNPARFIKYRFDQDQIQRLLEIKWWEKDFQWIKDNMPMLLNPDIRKFIEKHS
jgi:acetyltransferase-like isoleucine patch superfamily enzyme